MGVLLQIKYACKRYGDQILLDNAEATITDDKKVGFVGRNGAGKSTLLRVLLGEEELDRGEVSRHPRLQIGYLRQHDPFLPGETAIEVLQRDSGQPLRFKLDEEDAPGLLRREWAQALDLLDLGSGLRIDAERAASADDGRT